MKTMKVAVVHNTYQQKGGEDVVVAAETELLESRGHKVVRYIRSNDEIAAMSRPEQLFMVKNLIHSDKSKRELQALLRVEKPDVVHVHNTFMMISPSVYEACSDAGIPVIQTLHNYRLLCPGWSLSRNGEICEECLERGLWRGVLHGCYRDSRLMTAAVALMLQVHRTRGTWRESVDGYVALTNFARAKFIQGGLPASAVHVKPNFLAEDPGERESAGRNVLFIGRLSIEKGVNVLLDAWRKLNSAERLTIVGDGPLRKPFEAQTLESQLSNVTFLGWKTRAEIFTAIKDSSFVVLPSLSYEGFPMTLVEAFACGTPVICSDRGGLREIVDDGRTGLHFRAGDANDLASKMEWAWNHPAALRAMGRAAREEFEKSYTADANYEQLLQIYEKSAAYAARH
jgi:glycosyltransferase involved in cell wall biosynthesis